MRLGKFCWKIDSSGAVNDKQFDGRRYNSVMLKLTLIQRENWHKIVIEFSPFSDYAVHSGRKLSIAIQLHRHPELFRNSVSGNDEADDDDPLGEWLYVYTLVRLLQSVTACN